MAIRIEYLDGEEEVLEDGYSWHLEGDFVVVTDGGADKLKMIPKNRLAEIEKE